MAICEWCGQEYRQTKSWRRFCCTSHKDDWHNHQKSLALHQRKLAEVEEAEERREALSAILERMKSKPEAEARANGATGNHKPLSEVLGALPKPEALLKPEPSFKRAW